MKRGILLTCMICFVILTQVDAKIWRVNNIAGADADFTTLQAAHDGANAGDTLMLEPSPTSYGNLTSIKKVIIIGPGYFFSENFQNYPTFNTAKVGNIVFDAGSSGSQLTGTELGGVSTTAIKINVSDILISRTYTPGTSYFLQTSAGISNIFIFQNYNLAVFTSGNPSNIFIANNYLRAFSVTGTSSVVKNNIFSIGFSCTGLALSNNIIVGTGAITLTNCTLSNNIDASGLTNARFGTSNGNQGNLTVANVFVGATGNSTDGQWKLKAGSPAIGAGINGEDCGVYDGETPYVLSGLPGIPAFTKMINSSVGSNTNPIKVTVSIESKN